MPIEIRETYVNTTRDNMIGESGWYEPYTEDRGELFRSLQREYGGCTSRMYTDRKIPDPSAVYFSPMFTRLPKPARFETVAIGWVFSRREQYEDARGNRPSDFYIREVWVEVRETPDDATTGDIPS